MPEELYDNPEVNAQCWETSEDEGKEKKGQKGGRRKREGRKKRRICWTSSPSSPVQPLLTTKTQQDIWDRLTQ